MSVVSLTPFRPYSLAVLLGIAFLPLPLSAQDNRPWDCRTSPETGKWICETRDWVPLAELPPEQHTEKCRQCGGLYIDPLGDVDTSQAPEAADIRATAGSSELRGETITLSGGVEVNQGYRFLRSDGATFDRQTGEGELLGNVKVREPGVLLEAESAQVSTATGEALLQQASYLLHDFHLRGSAAELRRDEQGLIHIEDGQLSYCAPGTNDWSLGADTMELDVDNGVGTARGSKLRLGNVPVFYSPYLVFPLDDRRRSGVLWPDIGSDSRSGIDVAIPIYANLSPNYDLLYTPRLIEKRGLNNEFLARYLGRNSGRWSIGGAYMDEDKRYKSDFPDESSFSRWFVQAKQDGEYGKYWRSNIDYSKASDVNYLKDLDTDSLSNRRQTSLLQLGALDFRSSNWQVEAEVQRFQQMADDIRENYKKLPQVTGQYRNRNTPFRINPILLAQYSNFDIDDELRTTGQRVYAEAGASYPMLWQFGFLDTEVKYRQLNYELERVFIEGDDNPSAGAALANIDGGLVFERDTSAWGRSLVQTLEPRAYYLYSDYQDQTTNPDFDSAELTFSYGQLFRQTRFSGRDRIDDANQASLGVTTRFMDAMTGEEYLSASIGQIFYFEDRRVRLLPTDPPLETSSSEVAMEMTFQPNTRLGFLGNLVWDPHTDQVNVSNLQASYRLPNDSLFNAGYTYRRPQASQLDRLPITEQTHLSAWVPIGDSHWSVFAAWNYSLQANTSVEDMVGMEYDTCCWKVRILHLRYFDTDRQFALDPDDPDLDRENSTQIQVILKGMGGFGGRVSSILEDMIRGYRDIEN